MHVIDSRGKGAANRIHDAHPMFWCSGFREGGGGQVQVHDFISELRVLLR